MISETRRQQCRDASRRWRERNPEKVAELNRRHRDRQEYKKQYRSADRLKKEYGVTPADIDRVYAEQTGLCAVCGRDLPTGKRRHVDHDHKTGKVRGLVHQKCNMGLGLFDDDPGLLQKAAAYLLRHKEQEP